jgi:hypothetical protein
MNPESLNRKLNQILGILLALGIAFWILRGLGILTFIPGGVIFLLFFGAIGVAVFNYVQYRWWRF